jgi:hypothetical protein
MLLDYQRPEVESLAELFAGPGVSESVEWRMPQNHHVDSPFHLVRLPGDERLSAHVANRSKHELKSFMLSILLSLSFSFIDSSL